jgi:hypothetical protein
VNVFILPTLVEELFCRDTTGGEPATLEVLIDEVRNEIRQLAREKMKASSKGTSHHILKQPWLS